MFGSGCGSHENTFDTIPSCDIDEEPEVNLEDYLMNMTSLSNSSKGKSSGISHVTINTINTTKETSRPVVETVEKDVKQYNTKIVEEDPCSGKRAVMRVSHVLNKKTGTVITVQRTDYTGGCPVKDKNLTYGRNDSPSNH
ncbi:uncharacterized protein LOC105685330 isoform X2 [Athalia rosae]|uniref:uncharacterized protein LOC105685330 isoform X2 n=1 Tax=Athalia rosae TaxID=37344 RepID=UPI0006260F8E|nr:uncharacterized protein LOC105685330 isoform X2 [Athalia rosae]